MSEIRSLIIWPVRPCEQFPLKTIRKNVPYEGRMRRSDRAGKTRTTLLEMHTAQAKTTRNHFVAKKLFLENEWKRTFRQWVLLSRWAFGRLMLQLPAHSEATEKKTLLWNQEIKKFITSQQQANTVKKTTYDMNVFQRFLNECGEKRKVLEIFPEKLDRLLCNFHITAKKKDNSK